MRRRRPRMPSCRPSVRTRAVLFVVVLVVLDVRRAIARTAPGPPLVRRAAFVVLFGLVGGALRNEPAACVAGCAGAGVGMGARGGGGLDAHYGGCGGDGHGTRRGEGVLVLDMCWVGLDGEAEECVAGGLGAEGEVGGFDCGAIGEVLAVELGERPCGLVLCHV